MSTDATSLRGLAAAFVVMLMAASAAFAQQPANPPSAAPGPGGTTQPMQGQPMQGQTMISGQGSMANGQSEGPAAAAMMQAMRKMQQGMAAAPANATADQQFVAMMIPHHQGAIDMARVELQFGEDPAMRRLARNIVRAQEKEIKEMTGWQMKHPVP